MICDHVEQILIRSWNSERNKFRSKNVTMIYNLYQILEHWLSSHGMGFFRVFGYISFRAVVAIILSFGLVCQKY